MRRNWYWSNPSAYQSQIAIGGMSALVWSTGLGLKLRELIYPNRSNEAWLVYEFILSMACSTVMQHIPGIRRPHCDGRATLNGTSNGTGSNNDAMSRDDVTAADDVTSGSSWVRRDARYNLLRQCWFNNTVLDYVKGTLLWLVVFIVGVSNYWQLDGRTA